MRGMAGFRICPICGTRAHSSAAICLNCGASLSDVPVSGARPSPAPADVTFPPGGDDLLEQPVARARQPVYTGILFGGLLLVMVCIALFWIASGGMPRPDAAVPLEIVDTATSTFAVVMATNTLASSPRIATITPPPPTPTDEPTPSPCMRVVQPGDNLISIIFNCGYRSLDVMPEVLRLNNLRAPELIQQGQTIIVPLPTPTRDPNAVAQVVGLIAPLSADSAASQLPAQAEAASFATQTPIVIPTETLLPGVGYHVVSANESMVSIAYMYRTNAETLSQLNPEIPFSQCDYSLDSGGPRCTVLIRVGQRLRVPVPTATPTHTPTLTGSETPTPLPTATFNAPNLISPNNRVFFLRDELITLRWVGTGSLADDERYLVMVENLTSGESFRAQTRDLAFIIPEAWQMQTDTPADYQWSIGVVSVTQPDTPRYLTSPRLFTWQGRPGTSTRP